MNKRQFIKSLSIPLTAGLTDISSGYENIGLPKVPQSKFRILGEPLNPELLTMIKDYRTAYHSFTALNLEQQALVKYNEEADLQHIERSRNSFACVALNSAVIVAEQKLKDDFDKQENIYGLDYIFDGSTFNINEYFLKEQLVYTELLFITVNPTDTRLDNRMLQIVKLAKQMDIVTVVLT